MSKLAKIAAIFALVKLSSAAQKVSSTGCGMDWEGNLIPFNLCSPAEPNMDSQYQAYQYYCGTQEQHAVFGTYFTDAMCHKHLNLRKDNPPPECEAHDVTIVGDFNCNITNLFKSFNCEQDCEHYKVTDTIVTDDEETKDDGNHGDNDEGNDDNKTIIIYGIVALFIFICLFCSSR